MNEKWKDVKGFENVYMISSYGRLASIRNGNFYVLSIVNSKGGYLSVVLVKDKVRRSIRIHRLVYETFIGEIPKDRKYHIHHINHNKQDNRIENLILVTAKEHYQLDINSRNISGLRPIWENLNGKCSPRRVAQKTLDGNLLAIYKSAEEASLITGVCSRNIRQVASKEPYNKKGCVRKQAGGFIWEDVK